MSRTQAKREICHLPQAVGGSHGSLMEYMAKSCEQKDVSLVTPEKGAGLEVTVPLRAFEPSSGFSGLEGRDTIRSGTKGLLLACRKVQSMLKKGLKTHC